MRKLLLVTVVSSMAMLSSCKKDRVTVDPTITGNPVISVPIGQVNLTLEHIINPNDPNDTLITADPDNTYQVVIAQNNAINQSLALFNIPPTTLAQRKITLGTFPIPQLELDQGFSLGSLIDDVGGSLQGSLSSPVDSINAVQNLTMENVINTVGGSLQSSLSVADINFNEAVDMDTIFSSVGGSLSSSFAVADVNQTQSLSMDTLSSTIGGSFAAALSVPTINESENIALGTIQPILAPFNGTNRIFPPFSQTNAGTFSGAPITSFTSATFSAGTMDLEITNDWPVSLDMNVDLVNTANGNTIVSYAFTNVAPNGGTQSDSQSMVGKTLPNTIGFKITSISSPGSGITPVLIDTADAITMDITSSNLEASSYNAPFPALSETNAGTFSAGSLGSFTDATFKGGTMTLTLDNNWPVNLSMDIDLVDMTDNSTVLSFSVSNVSSGGGSKSDTKNLNGITLPSALGLKIASVSSPGSSGSSVNIDLADEIDLTISTNNMVPSGFTAPFPSISQTNVISFSSGAASNFVSATLSGGTMTLNMTNNWPVPLTIGVDLINTSNNATLMSFALPNVAANGGTSSDVVNLNGITLPNTIGFRVSSVSTAGSSSDVSFDLSDDIDFTISSSNMSASSFVAPFPSFSETNVGTFDADSLGNFTSASFSSGNLALKFTNNWPVVLSMGIEIVNSTTGSTLLSYNFSNVAANGGVSTQSNSLANVTLPSTLGFKITSVSSPGSPSTPVAVDLVDNIELNVIGSNMMASNFVAPFPSINETDALTTSLPAIPGFSSASFSKGSMSMQMTNDWPVPMSMDLEIVNTSNNSTVLSYSFSNVAANGGTATVSNSLAGITLPNTIGVKVASVSTPGSATDVNIDLSDSISFAIDGTNMEVYNAVVDVDSQSVAATDQIVDLKIGDVEVTEVQFNSGKLTYAFDSNIPTDVTLSLRLPSSDKNGSPLDTTILIPSNQPVSGYISLNNTLLDLSQDTTQAFSRLPITLSADILPSNGLVTIDSAQRINFEFGIDDIGYDYIEGYFGDTTLEFPSSSLPLNIDFLNQFDGEVTFEDPSLGVSITNNVGVPFGLGLDFTAYRNGIAYPLNGPNYIVPYPTTIGDSVTGTLLYDNTNSSITDVFTVPFDSVRYGGSVQMNPDTITYGKNNFITGDAKVSGDILLELPFVFSTSGLTLSQGLDSNLNISSQISSDYYEVEYAKLKLVATSTLPLDANVDLKFYDNAGTLLLVKPLPLLESGIPNSSGVVVSPSVLNTELTITSAEFETLKDATIAVAEATMVTYNGGQDAVKLRTDANINLAIGLEAKLKVDIQ